MKLVSHFSESLSLRMKLQHAKEDAGSRRDELDFFLWPLVCIEKKTPTLFVRQWSYITVMLHDLFEFTYVVLFRLLAPTSKRSFTIVIYNDWTWPVRRHEYHFFDTDS